MSGRMVNTNKFWCISFAANRERFSFLFVFFFFLFCFFPFSDWFFVIELLIQVYRLKYFLHIYPPLSTSFIISLLLSTSFIISLSYYPPLSSSLSLIIIFLMPLFLFVSAAIVILCCQVRSVFLIFSHLFLKQITTPGRKYQQIYLLR